MKKAAQTPEEKGDEPKNPELPIQRQIRERKENPTAKEKLQEITFNLTKDLPKFSSSENEFGSDRQSREDEIKNIRERKKIRSKGQELSPAKEAPQQKQNTAEEIWAVVENVNNHARGAVESLHDFVGGESRSRQLSQVRQRKNKNRGIER